MQTIAHFAPLHHAIGVSTRKKMIITAKTIAAFCAHNYEPLFSGENELSIVYIEGMNPSFTLNSDRPDKWNDLRLIMKYSEGAHKIIFCAIATTEPGIASTISTEAAKLGGVARIKFGFHKSRWIHGFHNYSRLKTRHPALLQVRNEPVMVHRDADRNGIRPGDMVLPAWGINQHGVLGTATDVVGKHSAGCLVGRDWNLHLDFLEILKSDPRYIANHQFAYSTWVIPGDKLWTFNQNIA